MAVASSALDSLADVGGYQEWRDTTDQPHWYAAFCPARERQVAAKLEQRGIECFWPHTVEHDSRAGRDVYRSLFPAYLFVRTTLANRLPVLTVPGLAYLVGFHDGPEPIPDHEIAQVRIALIESERIADVQQIPKGEKVRVARGPLTGLCGILREHRGKHQVVISVTLLGACRAVTVEPEWIERV